MPKKRKTNVDLVKSLMNYSPQGALCQPFIVQAIESYCDKVIEDMPAIIEKDKREGNRPFVSNEAWLKIAKDTKERIELFYETGELK